MEVILIIIKLRKTPCFGGLSAQHDGHAALPGVFLLGAEGKCDSHEGCEEKEFFHSDARLVAKIKQKNAPFKEDV